MAVMGFITMEIKGVVIYLNEKCGAWALGGRGHYDMKIRGRGQVM